MITKKTNNRYSTSAFVHFKNPESASKALRLKRHIFLDRIIRVKSAHNQPNQTKFQIEENNSNSMEYTILKINDDCLLLIFQYLSMQDQYNLSTLSPRLDNIYKLTIKRKKSLPIVRSDLLNLNCLRLVLEKVGDNIECITFDSSVDSLKKNLNLLLNFLSKFCPNLYKLQFNGVFLRYNDLFQKICTSFISLHHIELKNSGLHDDMIKKLTNLLNIKYLDVSYNNKITGLHLDNFYNLETLILNFCTNIESIHFVQICCTIKNLKELDINYCDKLDTNAIDALVNNLNHLEKLTICVDDKTVNYEKIAKLKSLKHLTFNEAFKNSQTLLIQLAKEKFNQLETLKIGRLTFDDIKGNAIKELIKLKQLDLPDAFITNQFFNDLSNLCDLKILNIPKSGKISCEIVLEYLNKAPKTLQEIDFFQLDCNEEIVTRALEILKLQRRPKPLILTLKCTSMKKKTFTEDDAVVLKIKNAENNYDFLERFNDYLDYSDSDSSYDSYSYYSDCYNY